MEDLEKRLATLESRVLELEDIEAVRELVTRYGLTADLGLANPYLDNFTEDGEYVVEGRPTLSGSGDLRRLIENPEGLHKAKVESRGSQHTSPNLVVRVDGDRAWAEGYSAVIVREGDGFEIFGAGYNHWDFRREDGRWSIARRHRMVIGDHQRGLAGPPAEVVLTQFVAARPDAAHTGTREDTENADR